MNHRATWGHPPRKPKRKGGAYFAAALGILIATGAMVLIAGGR